MSKDEDDAIVSPASSMDEDEAFVLQFV